MEEYEFTEYAPYSPTADDFDLEAQFGIKPLPLPADPGGTTGGTTSGRGPGLWLWVAAGVLAVITAGLLWYARRRRGAAVSA